MAVVCVAQSDTNRGFDRGIMKQTFIPKGQWLSGATFSYTEHQDDNYKFLVLKNMTTEGYTCKVTPFFGYFFANNVAAGLRFTYSRTYANLENIDIDFGDDLSFEIDDQYYLEHNFASTAFLRTYIPIGSSRIFGLFNEARLTYGYGQAKDTSGKGNDLTGTFQTINNLQVGIAPGMTAFITNFAAVEVSVGVLGFDFKWIDQKTDQIYDGSRTKSSGNFKIDLFSINLGMSFYF
ncbi:MAG: hypothetical protein Q4F97_00430 [Bacteroidales bacterium]|nr:hypothetical protein [Bacteroidales bacterium]